MCATLYQANDGREYILIGHQMLFFGATLSRSLLNPNQLQYFGIQVQDDYMRDEPFSVTIPPLFIPFSLMGT